MPRDPVRARSGAPRWAGNGAVRAGKGLRCAPCVGSIGPPLPGVTFSTRCSRRRGANAGRTRRRSPTSATRCSAVRPFPATVSASCRNATNPARQSTRLSSGSRSTRSARSAATRRVASCAGSHLFPCRRARRPWRAGSCSTSFLAARGRRRVMPAGSHGRWPTTRSANAFVVLPPTQIPARASARRGCSLPANADDGAGRVRWDSSTPPAPGGTSSRDWAAWRRHPSARPRPCRRSQPSGAPRTNVISTTPASPAVMSAVPKMPSPENSTCLGLSLVIV